MGKKDDVFVLKERGVGTTSSQGRSYSPGRLLYDSSDITIYTSDYNSATIVVKTEIISGTEFAFDVDIKDRDIVDSFFRYVNNAVVKINGQRALAHQLKQKTFYNSDLNGIQLIGAVIGALAYICFDYDDSQIKGTVTISS